MKQQWDDLRVLFDAALPLAAEARAQLLRERCGGDARFRRELEKLLEAHDEGAAEAARGAAGRRRFGGWETTELTGHSGIAESYLARRSDGEAPERAVLKVMPRRMLPAGYGERFRREREILMRLEHPHLARVLDGGLSEAGDPYLVMEQVDGTRLDEFCEVRGLALKARLRLFLALCRAVEAIHRNLILHRDIRPANVLVTREGVVKLGEFGAPGAMDAGAPEGETTASDVYGLGMTLHQIVPAAGVKGDIGDILRKAMESDPARQYGSAAQLAEDVERYLAKRPVNAHVNSWGYRAGRFAARHPVAAAVSGLLALTLAGVAAWRR